MRDETTGPLVSIKEVQISKNENKMLHIEKLKHGNLTIFY